VSLLEWILILEGVTLALVGVLGLFSLIIAKQNPDDPIYVFASTFWKTLLWPPEPMEIDDPKNPPAPRTRAAAVDKEPTEQDAFYGRIPNKSKMSTLDIVVEPNAPADVVAGRVDGGIKITVTGEAGEGRANKALIELVASAAGVKPYQVTLVKGHYQTKKTVQIQGIDEDQLTEKLSVLNDAEP
jgi:uncharacterized protein YggU (UPF0235/DUF167 family)